jgi:hypothetical protein
MQRVLFTLLTFAVCFANSARAEIRKFDKATIERLGVAIYEQDIRAAKATDLVLAKKIDAKAEGLRGWIVEGDANAMLVRFVREKNGVLEALYDVNFRGRDEPTVVTPADPKLTVSQLAQFKARLLAAKNIKRPASRSYNIVILPDPEADGYLVYALAATTEPNAVMVGGHYRFTVSKDGEKLLRSDELFVSFMVLSTKPDGLPPGATLAGLAMSTLVGDMPLETHVYLSLLHHLPFSVATANGKIWNVDQGKISPLN